MPDDNQPTEAPTARVCWWCGADGPLTLEHVVPTWMINVLHGQGTMDHAYAEPGASEPSRTWSKVSPDFKARVVCAACNGGWMADLENVARRRLKGAMGGVPRSFSRLDARILGRWAAKTAFMFQAMEPKAARVVPRELYEPLWKAEVLPPTVRVWAGKVHALGVFQHAFGGEISHDGRTARMFTSLVTFDRLALMVMGSPDPGLLEALKLGHLGNAWVELGDTGRSVDWPGTFTFDTENFMAMPQLMVKLAAIPPRTRLAPPAP